MWSKDAAVLYGSIRTRIGRVLLYSHYCKYRTRRVMAFVIYWILMASLAFGKLFLQWARMQEHWVQTNMGQ